MCGDEDALFYAAPPLMSRADMRRAWRERPVSTLVSTGVGIGMIPVAPGTWGSLEGLAIGVFVAGRLHLSPAAAFAISCIVALGIAAGGIVVSGPVEALAGVRDPGPIVIDEVAGQILAFAPASFFLPGRVPGTIPWWIVLGAPFLLFRLFDVWKPGPIRSLQELPKGWGIVADDLAAGAVAGAIVFAIGSWWR
jgi:phosphatidylglycerophosphatase A